jgi:hypothetical protein
MNSFVMSARAPQLLTECPGLSIDRYSLIYTELTSLYADPDRLEPSISIFQGLRVVAYSANDGQKAP